jgi:hypothetical protein
LHCAGGTILVTNMAFEVINLDTYANNFIERFLKLISPFLWGN